MKRAYLALVLVCFIVGLVAGLGAAQQQRLKFTEPVLADPGATDFALGQVLLDPFHGRVEIVLREADRDGKVLGKEDVRMRRNAELGKVLRVTYEGTAADAFIAALGVEDKILARLVADGKLPQPATVVQAVKDVER